MFQENFACMKYMLIAKHIACLSARGCALMVLPSSNSGAAG
jgi:hypothetical protein